MAAISQSTKKVLKPTTVATTPEPVIVRDVVRVVLGSTGEGDHNHEEIYWEANSPGKLEADKKIIKRRMRQQEIG